MDKAQHLKEGIVKATVLQLTKLRDIAWDRVKQMCTRHVRMQGCAVVGASAPYGMESAGATTRRERCGIAHTVDIAMQIVTLHSASHDTSRYNRIPHVAIQIN